MAALTPQYMAILKKILADRFVQFLAAFNGSLLPQPGQRRVILG